MFCRRASQIIIIMANMATQRISLGGSEVVLLLISDTHSFKYPTTIYFPAEGAIDFDLPRVPTQEP